MTTTNRSDAELVLKLERTSASKGEHKPVVGLMFTSAADPDRRVKVHVFVHSNCTVKNKK